MSDDVLDEAQVGSQVTVSITLKEPYQSLQFKPQTFAGQADLEDVTWTVAYYDQTGARADQRSFGEQNFSGAQIATADGTSEAEATVMEIVPEAESSNYDPTQTFTIISLDQTHEGGSSNDVDLWSVHHYTKEDAATRGELSSVRNAIKHVSGANMQQAEQTFVNAVEASNGEELSLTTNLVNEAEASANQAWQSGQTTQLLACTAGGLPVVALVVGGFLYWQFRQITYDKPG